MKTSLKVNLLPFHFFTAVHFHFGSRYSPFLICSPPLQKFSCISSPSFSSPFFSRSSSFSVIHVGVEISVKSKKRLGFYRVVTRFHPPNWHCPVSGSHKTFLFSYMKFLCLWKFLFIKVKVSSIFKEKKIQNCTSRIQSRSIGSAVHHLNPYTTKDLLTMNGLIWIYIATTVTLT